MTPLDAGSPQSEAVRSRPGRVSILRQLLDADRRVRIRSKWAHVAVALLVVGLSVLTGYDLRNVLSATDVAILHGAVTFALMGGAVGAASRSVVWGLLSPVVLLAAVLHMNPVITGGWRGMVTGPGEVIASVILFAPFLMIGWVSALTGGLLSAHRLTGR